MIGLLEAAAGGVRHVERLLGPQDDWVEDDRRILFEWLDKHFGEYYPYFVMQQGPGDYLTSADASPDVVEEVLMDTYQRNLLSGRKWRNTDGGKQWACGSFVDDNGTTQHHVYLFEGKWGNTDVYSHTEDSVQDADAHLNIHNTANDIDGLRRSTPGSVFDCLDRAGIEYYD